MKARNTGKGTLVSSRVGQINQPLNTERDRQFKADIPVKVRSREPVSSPFRRIKAHTVGRGPKICRSPDLGEDALDSLRPANRFQRRMMKKLHHYPVVALPLRP